MSDLFDSIQTFYQGNTEVSIAILIAIIIVLIVKPKAAGKLLVVIAAFIVIGYVIVTVVKPKAAGKLLVVIAAFIVIGYVIVTVTDLTGSAKDNKNEAAHKTDRGFHKSEE
jgi:hypothetical protein